MVLSKVNLNPPSGLFQVPCGRTLQAAGLLAPSGILGDAGNRESVPSTGKRKTDNMLV